MITNSWKSWVDEQNNTCWGYAQGDGTFARNSWKQIDGNWYVFSSSGAMRTGWVQSGKTWYYMDPETGVMVTGLLKIGGSLYFFNSSGAMATGWKQIDGVYYYFRNSGAAVISDWVKSGGKWYYLDSEGVMVSNCTIEIGGTSYTFNGSGAWVG